MPDTLFVCQIQSSNSKLISSYNYNPALKILLTMLIESVKNIQGVLYHKNRVIFSKKFYTSTMYRWIVSPPTALLVDRQRLSTKFSL